MTTGEKILKLRKESGLSQEAFAEKLGVSRQSVSKWESGVSIPETDKILAMSEMFRVSTDYLLKDDEVKAEEEIEPEEEANQAHGGNEETENKKTFSGKKLTAVLATVLAAGDIVFTAKKLTSGIKKAIAIVAIICIIITAICVPVHFGGIKETWWALCGGKVEYPYVLVHGLGGWGETTGVNNAVTYWAPPRATSPFILKSRATPFTRQASVPFQAPGTECASFTLSLREQPLTTARLIQKSITTHATAENTQLPL